MKGILFYVYYGSIRLGVLSIPKQDIFLAVDCSTGEIMLVSAVVCTYSFSDNQD